MNFITARELRLNTSDLWTMLDKERELVVTLNGRPVALLTGISGETLEDTLKAVRRARGEWAIDKLRQEAREKGLDRMSDDDIDRIIRQTRKDRARR
jgi:antitoxin (DNA-binding transcriptional repressor) of toxin-antitoxin stability system